MLWLERGGQPPPQRQKEWKGDPSRVASLGKGLAGHLSVLPMWSQLISFRLQEGGNVSALQMLQWEQPAWKVILSELGPVQPPDTKPAAASGWSL